MSTTALICPECGADMILRVSKKYGGRKFYGCSRWPACKATHGAHADGTPLGIPASKETKVWRIKAHDAFDRLWQDGSMSRNEAYRWLQEAMGLSSRECHIGRFNIAECQRVIQLCNAQ